MTLIGALGEGPGFFLKKELALASLNAVRPAHTYFAPKRSLIKAPLE